MKKYLKFLSIIVVSFILAGCYKLDTKMEIKSDKSMTFEMIYAIDKKAFESFGASEDETENIDVEEYKEILEPKGFAITPYSEQTDEHNWQGIVISKNYANIDDLTTAETHEVNMTGEAGDDILTNENFFYKNGDNYVANIAYDFTSDGEEYDYSQIQNMVSLKYTVILPKESVSNNADSVSEDGKTLTWNLKLNKKNTINYEFNIPQKGVTSSLPSWVIPVSVGGGLLLSAAIVIIVLTLNKKKNQ